MLPYRQLSPHLANCCLRLSATVSYEQAERDIAYLTGIRVPAKTQQRLVHRQTFELPEIEQAIAQLSVDGGKVRLRTPVGEECEWKDYKAIATDQGMLANFQNNAQLIDWVNHQSLAQPVVCSGDGHDGVWNIISQIATTEQRLEILDWYHLVDAKENRRRTFVSICVNINIASSITSIFRLKGCTLLVQVQLNQLSNRLVVACNFQEHNGIAKMSLKF